MTRKTNSKFLTIKQLLVFILAILMCLSLFMATACKEDGDNSADIPEYSHSDNADSEIKNPSFTFGTQSMDYDDFPKTTIDGWSFTKIADSKSGVVDVSASGWKQLMPNLYKDNGLLSYVKYKYDFDDSDIRDAIRNGDTSVTVTSSEIKDYVIENYFFKAEDQNPGDKYAFPNPGTHQDATDNKVYMLNNYVSGALYYGCTQTVTSSTEITLNCGEYAKVSVWVKTANLNISETSANHNQPIGANISVKNTFNGSAQSNYGIYNITNTDWQQYTFYIKADEVFETKFTLQLGLGYDNFAATGTVYFDDITVELLDSDEFASSTKDYTNKVENKISYNDKDAKPIVNASEYLNNANDTLYLYDMCVNLAEISNYSNIVSFNSDKTNTTYYDFTKYKEGLKNGNFTNSNNSVSINTNKTGLDAPYGITEGLEVKINKASSYTIRLDDNGKPFKLENESYAAITLLVKNDLNKFYTTDITINVEDKYGDVIKERAAVATISEANNEWTKYTIIVKNNFDEDAKDQNGNNKYSDREFYLEIVIGPDKYDDYIDNYALGTVTFASPIVSFGKTYQYANEQAELKKEETPFYKFYNLLSESSVGSTALYTGFNEDYTAEETDPTVYSLVVAPSNIGMIVENPATPKSYTGIEAGHYYITNDLNDSMKVNNNQYSGLINSNYLNNYAGKANLADIKTALNYNGDTSIQPLMIKTNDKSYGFLGENIIVSANAYAKVSLKVRVYNATAYIYLVDTSETEKQVLRLDKFTVNTELGKYNNNNQEIDNELFFMINDSMLSELSDDGWATVEFYIATGATEKEFRIELWNGERGNANQLTQNGYVFFDDVEVTTSNAFNETARWEDALTDETSPLYNQADYFKNNTDLILYERELTDLEKKYNSEHSDKISYRPKYVWAKTDTLIYAIYNTIDPIEVDPYASDVEDDATTKDESLYETDPAAFWLSLSSIIIGVALIVAIIMLFIKNIRRRRKANRSDAKSHYTVKSRTKKSTKPVEEVDVDIDIDSDEPTTSDGSDEQSLDSYVYSDVQVFGEDESSKEKNDDNN